MAVTTTNSKLTSAISRSAGTKHAQRGRSGLTRTLQVLLATVTMLSIMGVIGISPSDAAQQKSPGASWFTNGTVWDLVRVDNVIYAGGEFTEVRNNNNQVASRSNLVAFDALTGEVLAWNPVVDGPVLALEASPDGSHIYLGGNFSSVNGTDRLRLAAVDAAGSLHNGFRADVGGRVMELLHSGQHLIVAGEVVWIDGESRTLIGRIDGTTGALDEDWVPAITGGSIRGVELSPDGQHLYIGGDFSAADTLNDTAYLARLSMTTGRADGAWLPGMDMPVFDVEATVDSVYAAVAGRGFKNNRLQKHSATDGSELLRYLADGDVQDLEIRDDTLYIGGHFTKVFGGLPRSQMAAIDLTDDHITNFDPNVVTTYGVWKILAGSEGLWLAGEFTAIEDVARHGFAFLPNDGQPETQEALLLSRDAAWRYVANGSSPTVGTQWTQPGYNDAAWASGQGEFGFGDGDEQTVTQSTDSLYARTVVAVDNPNAFDDITIRVLADAGAAVYVNGVEVGRHNLPSGQLNGETLALSGKWTSGEKTWTDIAVAPSAFVAGANTVAIEVHGAYDNPGDMSFQSEIVANVSQNPAPGPVLEPQPSDTPIDVISSGDSWSFLDDGSLTGTDWRATGFDDTPWPTGSGQFGFGDGDEQTVVEAGHRVYWFRNSFDLVHGPTEATIRVLADDGFAVYVNGTEVTRKNLPDGPINHRTVAVDPLWGAGERAWSDIAVDPGLLRAGRNTVAVSVHNIWAGNNDLSFDLGLRVSGNAGPAGPPPEPEVDLGPRTLVGAEAAWAFLDDGSEPAPAWNTLAFDDQNWSVGDGHFGFGDGDESTTLTSGHTAYFLRHTFDVDHIPASLTLSSAFDDGLVVYVNGHEVVRSNMANGAIHAATKAAGPRWGAAESTPETFTIDPGLLVQGSNVIAVSVHNVWSGNSDLSFDAELWAEG